MPQRLPLSQLERKSIGCVGSSSMNHCHIFIHFFIDEFHSKHYLLVEQLFQLPWSSSQLVLIETWRNMHWCIKVKMPIFLNRIRMRKRSFALWHLSFLTHCHVPRCGWTLNNDRAFAIPYDTVCTGPPMSTAHPLSILDGDIGGALIVQNTRGPTMMGFRTAQILYGRS